MTEDDTILRSAEQIALRAEEDASSAANFLFARVQELEGSVVSLRGHLESSRHREESLLASVQGFRTLLAQRHEREKEASVAATSSLEREKEMQLRMSVLLAENEKLRSRIDRLWCTQKPPAMECRRDAAVKAADNAPTEEALKCTPTTVLAYLGQLAREKDELREQLAASYRTIHSLHAEPSFSNGLPPVPLQYALQALESRRNQPTATVAVPVFALEKYVSLRGVL